MAATVDILIKATDQASAVLRSTADATQDLGKGAKEASGGMSGLSGGMGDVVEGLTGINIGAISAAGAIAGMTALVKQSIADASDMSETTSKVGVVFGDSAEQVLAFGSTAAQSMGMSSQAALDAAGTLGNLFVSMGLTTQKSADMSTSLIQLASDLASFNNLDPTEVLEKLRAGLTGESEPLKSLGVNINAAMVEAKAMELGLTSLGGELTAAAKAQATYALILEQTKTAQGDFVRTSEGLANQQRILEAQWKNLTTTAGQQFTPAALGAVTALNNLLSVQAQATKGMQEANATWVTSIPVIGAVANGIAYLREEQELTAAANLKMLPTEERARDAAQRNAAASAKNAQALEKTAESTASASWQMDAYRASVDQTAQATDEIRNRQLAYNDLMKQQVDLQKQVEAAQNAVTTAEQNWASSTGGQMAGMLEQNRLGWDKYREGLATIDKVMNTNLGSEADQKKAMEDLAKKYNSGKMSQAEFESGLRNIQGQFQSTSSQVEVATQKLNELEAKLSSLNGKVVTISVEVNDGSGNGNQDGETGQCFVGDTLVNTPKGMRAIASLKAGEMVLLKTEAGPVVSVPVMWVKSYRRDDVVQVRTSDGQSFLCSPNHEWKTKQCGWVWAAMLRPGDELYTADDSPVHVLEVKPAPGTYTVWDARVDHEEHTFLVGGIVVHNAEKLSTGGQFVIPAGYGSGSTESWPVGPGMYAGSNEVVTVTPAGRSAPKAYAYNMGAGGTSGGITLIVQGNMILQGVQNTQQLSAELGRRSNLAMRSGARRAGT